MENDLISRNTLVAAIQEYQMNLFHDKFRLGEIDLNSASVLANVERIVCEAPSIETEPVRHGRWVSVSLVDHKGRVLMEQYKCSECGRLEDNKQPYCHCGCKMDAKEDDHG